MQTWSNRIVSPQNRLLINMKTETTSPSDGRTDRYTVRLTGRQDYIACARLENDNILSQSRCTQKSTDMSRHSGRLSDRRTNIQIDTDRQTGKVIPQVQVLGDRMVSPK